MEPFEIANLEDVRVHFPPGRPRKLQIEQIRFLVRLAMSGKYRCRELASRFGISQRTVRQTLRDVRTGKLVL